METKRTEERTANIHEGNFLPDTINKRIDELIARNPIQTGSLRSVRMHIRKPRRTREWVMAAQAANRHLPDTALPNRENGDRNKREGKPNRAHIFQGIRTTAFASG